MLNNPTTGGKLFISAKEAAEMLNVSMPIMYQLANSEGFPAMRIGKKVMINVEGLRSWAAEKCGMHN